MAGESDWADAGSAVEPAEYLRVWWDGNIRPRGDNQFVPSNGDKADGNANKNAGLYAATAKANKVATVKCKIEQGDQSLEVSCPSGTFVASIGGNVVTWAVNNMGVVTHQICGLPVEITATATTDAGETASSTTRGGTLCGPYITSNDKTRISVGNQKIGVAWSSASSTESGEQAGKGKPGAKVNSAQLEWKATTDTAWNSATIDINGGDNGVWYADATGLTAGVAYDIRIRLQNDGGDGDAATNWWGFWHYRTTEAVKSTGSAPGAPSSPSATAGNAQIAVSWTAPSSNGGAAISHYQIRHRVSPSGAWTTTTVLGSAPATPSAASPTAPITTSRYGPPTPTANPPGPPSAPPTAPPPSRL